MNTNPSPSQLASPSLIKGVARILIIVGGTFQNLVRYLKAAAADLVLYVDVPSELSSARPRKDVRLLALAPGQTLGTLLHGGAGPKALEQLYASRPGINLDWGAGQVPAIGELAGQKLIKDPVFMHFLESQIFDPLFILHNGAIREVRIDIHCSGAGGVGNPVGPMIGDKIKKFFIESLGVVTEVHYLRAGSLTFTSLGRRVHVNQAAATDRDLGYICASDRDPLEVRRATFFEAPMVKDQKIARDAFVVQLAQALRSRAVQEELNRRSANAALDSELGTVTLLHVSYWHALPVRGIAAAMARDYLPRLDQVRQTGPMMHRFHSAEVALRAEPTPALKSQTELGDLMRRHGKVMPPDLLELCLQPPEKHPEATVVVVIDAEKLNLTEDFRVVCRQPARTESEFRAKLERLSTIRDGLRKETDTRTRKLPALRGKSEEMQHALKKHLRRLYPIAWFDRFVAALSNPQNSRVVFFNLMARCREALKELAKLEAELEAMSQVLVKVEEEIGNERKRLSGVVHFLTVHRPVEGAAAETGLVEVVPLDEILPAMLEASWGSSPDVLVEVLAAGIRRVTLKGLAEITQATEPTAEAIAAALVTKTPPYEAPVWGGKLPLTEGRKIIALPPVSEDVETNIREAVAAVDGDTVVVSADTAEAGANVIRLEIREPKSRAEILTPFYTRELAKAKLEPELHGLSGSSDGKPTGDGQPESRLAVH